MNLRKWLGNLLILLSLGILFFTYYPVIRVFIQTSPNKSLVINSDFMINIPKINATAPIIENVNPWKESEYKKALSLGVAQASGFATPGENKRPVFLFAHSSLPPWEMTRTNTSFLRLGELKRGDEIMIQKSGKQYRYSVLEKKEVWPSQVNTLFNESGADLILQTCTPIGTSLKRLLVFASLKNTN